VVKYKTLEEPFSEDQIVGRDISEGGVAFTVYERFAKGTILDLQITVPFDAMPIFAKAKVSWIKKLEAQHPGAYEVGAEFMEVDARDQKRFKLYIKEEIGKDK